MPVVRVILQQTGLSALLLMFVACDTATEIAAQRGALTTGDTGHLLWVAFECSKYAGMAGEPQQEVQRLFLLGYENGKRFMDAVRNKKISEAEIRSKVPIGVTLLMTGPTTDFILGRIFEAATGEAYDRVVKADANGIHLLADKWRMDAEVQKVLAGNEYRLRNCALFK